MVVCKCRKATKLYCFVHKIPVCGECICFPEHQLCVVRTYSEWVIDGDYDWPTKCSLCQLAFQDADAEAATRLGCLHLLHTACVERHLQSFPAHTAPAGYVCPSCSASVWPPKHFRDGGPGLPSRLKELLSQVVPGLVSSSESVPTSQQSSAPPAFSSAPLATVASTSSDKDLQASRALSHDAQGVSRAESGGFADASSLHGSRPYLVSGSAVPEIEAAGSHGANLSNPGPSTSPQFQKSPALPSLLPGALARKISYSRGERSPSIHQDGYEDDDGSHRKYTRRGPISRQLMKLVLPFWSSALPILPVTAPRREDLAEESLESRPRRRSNRSAPVDPRKILLFFAIMSCMATMMLLYYRLAQSSSDSGPVEEQ